MLRILVTLFLAIPSVSLALETHRASFIDPNSGSSIMIELRPVHPYLAEYKRFLIVRKGGRITQQKLAMDTGGYAATNVYICSDKRIMLDGHMDSALINTSTGKIEFGRCTGKRTYFGVFDGGGNKQWLFFTAANRHETVLEMRGG